MSVHIVQLRFKTDYFYIPEFQEVCYNTKLDLLGV